MPENKSNALLVFVVALAFTGTTLVLAQQSHSQLSASSEPPQQQQAVNEPNASSTKLTAATRPRTASHSSGATASSTFSLAAAQNTHLRSSLAWQFGGRQQRGWYLYESLINRTLGIDTDASTGEFAEALSRWQTSAGLRPSGILDNDTWFKMFSDWQARRLKDKSTPPLERFVNVPASDFWDETRPEELRKVEREAYAAYKRMVAAAAADPLLRLATTKTGELAPAEKYLKIISSFRSREYQEQLRRQSPHAGSAGLAVNSPHFSGRALDIYVGGEPVSTADANRAIQVQTPVYKWLVRNAERFGFRPYYYEPWHWEYVGLQ